MSQLGQDNVERVAQVTLELRDKIAFITFDHVAARNAMTVGMYQSLKTICQDLANNSDVRVAILRGAGGKSFVSGSDIAQFASFTSGQDGVRYEEGIDDYLSPLALLPIPTIAVIDGMAVEAVALAHQREARVDRRGLAVGREERRGHQRARAEFGGLALGRAVLDVLHANTGGSAATLICPSRGSVRPPGNHRTTPPEPTTGSRVNRNSVRQNPCPRHVRQTRSRTRCIASPRAHIRAPSCTN